MKTVRIAAIGDLHVQPNGGEKYQKLFTRIGKSADILVLCGDLTDEGLPSEAHALGELLASLPIPVVGVLGNHDFENGKQGEVANICSQHKMIILDHEPVEIHGIGFAGVKGFGGGFENRMVEAWGEDILKRFVYETVNEALKLENALAKLKTKHKVVALHYAPIRQTLEGEPLEIYPFLGSSRLAVPIDTFGATTVFHGHAHYGIHKGETTRGIPVYNVASPLLERVNPKQPYALIEL